MRYDCGMAATGIRVLGGRYRLLEVLGTGGMATVYLAGDDVLGREVAVKVLNPQYAADPGFLARFEREARHVARLNHPRIVTVFDCGIDGETPYIVMELAAGRTLRQILDEGGPRPPGEAAGIAAAVCEALEAAHSAGLVHRDIKPANIMLSGGQVKVLDFGIARGGNPAGDTRTQAILGTAAYLSPELASGGQAGPQADLYSLGCVLFEMLTGAPPFTGDSPVGIAYRHVHSDPGPPSARRPGVPAALDEITTRLLAKDPAARPPGAAAARVALLAAAGPDRTAVLDAPVDNGIPGLPSWRESWRPAQRPRWRPRLAEVLLAVALAGALAALAATLAAGPGTARTAGLAVSPSRPTPTAQASPTSAQPSPTASDTSTPSASDASTPPASAPSAPDASTPPTAAAAAAFVGDLEAGVASGQVTQQAGQDLFNHLQQLLFGAPAQDSQQVDQQYSQLIQAYDQDQSQGQITGPAAVTLRHALDALGAAVGAL
jgi:eukaryotic-like serine/threonine-protein kinase